MQDNLIKLTSAGLYLLGNGKRVQVSTDHCLVIVFHSPSSSSSAIILEEASEHRSDFIEAVTDIFQKYSSLSDVDSALIKAKVFGTKPHFSPLMSSLNKWLAHHRVPIVASDFGKAFYGQAIIDCSTGKIGFQFNAQQKQSLLSSGTARDRRPSAESKVKILILSRNPVYQTLVRQAIEEDDCWKAHSLSVVSKKTIDQALKDFGFSAIILTDEFTTDPSIEQTVLALSKNYPDMIIGWIGRELPQWEIKNIKHLPPLEPYLIPRFKKILKQSLSQVFFSKTSQTFLFSPKARAEGSK